MKKTKNGCLACGLFSVIRLASLHGVINHSMGASNATLHGNGCIQSIDIFEIRFVWKFFSCVRGFYFVIAQINDFCMQVCVSIWMLWRRKITTERHNDEIWMNWIFYWVIVTGNYRMSMITYSFLCIKIVWRRQTKMYQLTTDAGFVSAPPAEISTEIIVKNRNVIRELQSDDLFYLERDLEFREKVNFR